MDDKKRKTEAIEVLPKMVDKYFEKVPDDQKNYIIDNFIEKLYIEIWNLNKKQLTEEIDKKYEGNFQEQVDKLKNENDKKCKKCSLQRVREFLFNGILIGFLVGIGVNQITELIGILKEVIKKSFNVSISISTLIIVILFILILIVFIEGYIVDKLNDFNNDNT